MSVTATQRERVLAKARTAAGVCQADFGSPTCDGGPPITRVAARLHELDLDGFSFEVLPWRSKCKVFRLISEPTVALTQPSPPVVVSPLVDPTLVGPELTLFEAPRATRGFADQEAA
jgi:hypothetical protein